jgi:hypothetical protein
MQEFVIAMKVFHCTHCQHLVFFENTLCLRCGHKLAYLPDVKGMGSLDPLEEDLWQCPGPREKRTYRLCANYRKENVCNWAIPAHVAHTLCDSCRLTRVVPALSESGNREAWYRLETAKRRLLYSLWRLGCPVVSKLDDPERGLSFQFLSDQNGGSDAPVLTGHANGVITINLAESDDVERERRRQQLHEPYRTLLGHLRHESGHYYWNLLIKETPLIDPFREAFGNEGRDYGQALKDHYESGPPEDWAEKFVSAYASAHPWEDWAETWAHYIHMTDTLETAQTCGLSLRPRRSDEPSLETASVPGTRQSSFDKLITNWFPLTYLLNNLNRGLGLPDGYPFTLSRTAIDKLRFVHTAITACSHSRVN